MELGSAAKTEPYVENENSGEAEMTMLKSFLRDEKGATAIEYGLIAAGISHRCGSTGLEPEHDLRQREERAELRLSAHRFARAPGQELFRCGAQRKRNRPRSAR
jgi:Flp/Fap pilin component